MKKLASFCVLSYGGILLGSIEAKSVALTQRAPFVSQIEAGVTKALDLAVNRSWKNLNAALDTLEGEIASIDSAQVVALMSEDDTASQLKVWAEEKAHHLRSIMGMIGAYSPPGDVWRKWIKSDFDHALISKIGLPMLIPKQWEEKFFSQEDISLAKFAGLPLIQQAIIFNKIWRLASGSINVNYGMDRGDFWEIRRRLYEFLNYGPEAQKSLRTLFNADVRALMPATSALTYDDFFTLEGNYTHEMYAVQGVIEATAFTPNLIHDISLLAEADAVIQRMGWEKVLDLEKIKAATPPPNKVEEAVLQDLKSLAATWFFARVSNTQSQELGFAVAEVLASRSREPAGEK